MFRLLIGTKTAQIYKNSFQPGQREDATSLEARPARIGMNNKNSTIDRISTAHEVRAWER